MVLGLAFTALSCGGSEPRAQAPGEMARSTRDDPATAPQGRTGRWLACSGQAQTDARSAAAVWVDAEGSSPPSALPFSHSLSWSPNGQWLAGCTPEGEVALVPVANSRLGEALRAGPCGKLFWAQGSRQLAVLTPSETATIDLAAAPQRRQLDAGGRDRARWSASAEHLLVARSGEADQLFALTTAGLQRVPLDLPEGQPTRCRFSTDGAVVACAISGAGHAALAVFHLQGTTARAESFPLDTVQPIDFLEWTADRHVVLSTVHDTRLRLWPGFSTLLQRPSGLDQFRLASSGSLLLDVTGASARIAQFGAHAREQSLPAVGALLNPRIAPDERSALVGAAHPTQPTRQADVWLLRDLQTTAVATKLVQAPAGRVSSAEFSAGSGWVVVRLAADRVPALANSGSAGATAGVEMLAINLQSGARSSLAESDPHFAPDDSALASVAAGDGGVVLRRATGDGISRQAELVVPLRSGSVEIAWQP